MTTTNTIQALGPENVQAGDHRVWHSPRPATLQVRQGRVWVTASDSLNDHFVDAGASLEMPAGTRVVIGAESAARFEIVAAARRETGLLSAWRALLPARGRSRGPAPRRHIAPA